MPAARIGGVVLAGGEGSRLGSRKQNLDWHGCSLAARAARLLERGTGGGPLVVVGEHGSQERSGLPESARSTCDEIAGNGPLAGIGAGLKALQGRAEIAVVIPCDLPLIHPRLISLLAERAASGRSPVTGLVSDEGRPRALPAAWSTEACEAVSSALGDGELRLWSVAAELGFEGLTRSELLADPELALADPDLTCLIDLDTEHDAGVLEELAPKVRISLDGRLSAQLAWTLGDLVERLGCGPAPGCVVNGRPVMFDPLFPLVTRDAVALSASL
jgi:molybdopterin-guanine dinucleotide biosynthesis protein A